MAIGIGAAIAGSAISGIASSAINSGLGWARKEEDNKFAAAEAAKQRAWSEKMSNTAFQRQVKDMEAAGLNPAAIYAKGGGGSSTPAGDSATASSGGMYTESLSNYLNSAANLVQAFNYDNNAKNDMHKNDLLEITHNYNKHEFRKIEKSIYDTNWDNLDL